MKTPTAPSAPRCSCWWQQALADDAASGATPPEGRVIVAPGQHCTNMMRQKRHTAQHSALRAAAAQLQVCTCCCHSHAVGRCTLSAAAAAAAAAHRPVPCRRAKLGHLLPTSRVRDTRPMSHCERVDTYPSAVPTARFSIPGTRPTGRLSGRSCSTSTSPASSSHTSVMRVRMWISLQQGSTQTGKQHVQQGGHRGKARGYSLTMVVVCRKTSVKGQQECSTDTHATLGQPP